jgi:hypothetical protein
MLCYQGTQRIVSWHAGIVEPRQKDIAKITKHVPVSPVQQRHRATPDELGSEHIQPLLPRLVAVTQDPWHVENRIMRRVPRDAADFKKFKSKIKEIVARGSTNFHDVIVAKNVADLEDKVVAEVRTLQELLLQVIADFRVAKSDAAAAESQFEAAARQVGACADKTTSAAAEPGADMATSDAISLKAADIFQQVSAEEVRVISALAPFTASDTSATVHNHCSSKPTVLAMLQLTPNPDFGGTEADISQLLRTLGVFVAIPSASETSTQLKHVVQACNSPDASHDLEELFATLPVDDYPHIRQRTPAWFELRRRVPITSTRAWDLLLLGLTPARARSGWQPKMVIKPFRKGATCSLHDGLSASEALYEMTSEIPIALICIVPSHELW